MKEPEKNIKEFDPGDILLKNYTFLYITNRQDWIPGWFESKRESLENGKALAEEFLNLEVRRCPSGRWAILGILIYYPLFKWRRVVFTWLWKNIFRHVLKMLTAIGKALVYPFVYSSKKIIGWFKENEDFIDDLIDNAISCLPKSSIWIVLGFAFLALWIAFDHGYHRDVADGAKTVAVTVAKAPVEVKEAAVDWQVKRATEQAQARRAAEQAQLEAMKIMQARIAWEKEHPDQVAALKAEQEKRYQRKLAAEREATKRKWKKRFLGGLEFLKNAGILLLALAGIILAGGLLVTAFWYLVSMVKPLARLMHMAYEGLLVGIVLFFIAFEKYTPTFYRWTERAYNFVVEDIPAFLHRVWTWLCKFWALIVFGWHWLSEMVCPTVSNPEASKMVASLDAQLKAMGDLDPTPKVES